MDDKFILNPACWVLITECAAGSSDHCETHAILHTAKASHVYFKYKNTILVSFVIH